jgi:IS4 transposase
LADLDQRGVIWVSRAKENMAYEVKAKLPVDEGSKVVRDELIWRPQAKQGEVEVMRRVEAWVEVDGEERLMVFVTNQMDWSPQTIVDLYRCRWMIEVFFKQIKQTLQLADFLGHNANAVRWQVWTALLVYVLLRFLAHVSQWPHSFTRLFTLVRAALWKRLDLRSLLERYGTAGGSYRMLGAPEQAYLPGLG